MGSEKHEGTCNNATSLPQATKKREIKPSNMREEISLELAEIGNLNPKYEPMTPNNRQKSESEKTYR